jgi:cytochrome c peroxidase
MAGKAGRAAVCAIGCLLSGFVASGQSLPDLYPLPNGSGLLETKNAGGGPIDLTGPFFQALGTNGRSCGTCHRPAQAWGISADEVKSRFLLTQGNDPIFRTTDGSNCDHNIDTTDLEGRRKAYSLLMSRGLIRVALAVPDTAEFNIVSVRNPYGCSDTVTLSLYRRPLPSTNLRFLSTLMWDGRESSAQTGTQKIIFPTNPGDLLADLAHQSVDATSGHAQGLALLTSQQQQAIVNFETALTTAQAYDYRAGALNALGATGGPVSLASQTMPAFFVGINDPLGGNPNLTPFTPAIFDLFAAWVNPQSSSGEDRNYGGDPSSHRASIARGQILFNSKPIRITNVAGSTTS